MRQRLEQEYVDATVIDTGTARLPTRAEMQAILGGVITRAVIGGTDDSCVRRHSPQSDRYVHHRHCRLPPGTGQWHSQLDRQTHTISDDFISHSARAESLGVGPTHVQDRLECWYVTTFQ